MATRKALDNQDENPTKRRRVVQDVDEVSEEANLASFEDVNEDCLVKILSYLSVEEMNTVAMVNKICQEARSNESLDQTRTGTIVCSEQSSIRSIVNAIRAGEWNSVFSGNRTHLRIKNIASVRFGYSLIEEDAPLARLSGVTSLDLSCSPGSTAEVQRKRTINELLRLLPSLKKMDFSHVKVSPSSVLGVYRNLCPELTRITGTGSTIYLYISGTGLCNAQNHTELYLDDSRLLSPHDTTTRGFYESPTSVFPPDHFLFSECRSLERLSIKGATWGEDNESPSEFQPFSQMMLIKMVRKQTNLRWLRSDLSDENVEILKRERPEITFVS